MSLKSRLFWWLYGIITTIIAPLGMLFLMYKKRRDPPYGKRACELLGHYQIGFRNCIWFHTVSMGEAVAARPLTITKPTVNTGVRVPTWFITPPTP